MNELLHRSKIGDLPITILAVVSNHNYLRALTSNYQIPYYFLPIRAGCQEAQEIRLVTLFEETQADPLVLARYMQVLSPKTVARVQGRCINIHHSFLPSFKGAQPYHQAHEKGVKLIGATTHFVTSSLDEGPIIEQDVERVDHRATAEDLVKIGRDIEARVLTRAVRWMAERRVFVNEKRTVVFR